MNNDPPGEGAAAGAGAPKADDAALGPKLNPPPPEGGGGGCWAMVGLPEAGEAG